MSLANKKKIRDERAALLLYNFKQEWEREGVELFKMNEYLYRLVRDGHAVDYYPTSGKYFDNKFNKWGYTTPVTIIDLLFARKTHIK